jgi:hypothetical protein
MINSFSTGEGKEKMKDFAIKIIGSYPAQLSRDVYAESVVG